RVGDRTVSASIGFAEARPGMSAEELDRLADQAAIARKKERGVSRPREDEASAVAPDERAVMEPPSGSAAEDQPAAQRAEPAEPARQPSGLPAEAWFTPRTSDSPLAALQSAGLPAGRLYALDRPCESPYHDASQAIRVRLPEVKNVFDPDGLLDPSRAAEHARIHREILNELAASGVTDLGEFRREFARKLRERGFDAYIRGIDGDPNNRELIVLDEPEAQTEEAAQAGRFAAPPEARQPEPTETEVPQIGQRTEPEEAPAAARATPAADLPIRVSPDDIPYQVAYDAYRWSSLTPERRARQTQEEYVRHIEAVYEDLAPLARTEEQRRVLIDELERDRRGYVERELELPRATSRTASPMVTGPARFPVD